jgi:hypothetical protein
VEKKESAVRTAMHGRILRCPLGGNPTDCPLYNIRLLPVEERLKWLDSKTDFELTALFGYHIQCLEKKRAAGANRPVVQMN